MHQPMLTPLTADFSEGALDDGRPRLHAVSLEMLKVGPFQIARRALPQQEDAARPVPLSGATASRSSRPLI